MAKYDRKRIEAAIELMRLTADRRRPELQSTQLLRLAADMLDYQLTLFDRALKGALHPTAARERELSQVLGLVEQDPLVADVFEDDFEEIETTPVTLSRAR